MCAILLSTVLVWATPDEVLSASVKCADRRTVKKIHRHAREHTIEKNYTYIHTYIHINIYIADFHSTQLMVARLLRSLTDYSPTPTKIIGRIFNEIAKT